MPKEGQTGLVIPVPAADELLTSVARRYPGAVRAGVPAHVSVLYPFLPADELGEAVTDWLSSLFAEQPSMRVTFAECRRRAGFAYLRPDPIEELAALIGRVRQRWPGVVPYEGVYEDVEPHLTIAMRTEEEIAAAIQREVGAELPISAELREAWLVAFDGRWSSRGRFSFNGDPERSHRPPV